MRDLAHEGWQGGCVTLTIEPLDRRLSNGLRVVAHSDHTTPVVAVNVWYGVGSRHEQPSRTGFAHQD